MDIGTLTGSVSIEDKVSDTLSRVGNAVWKFAEDFDGALGAAAVGAGIVVGAIASIAVSIQMLGSRGSDINDVASTLDRFAGSAENAEAIMAKLRAGTMDTVDNFDLMKSSSKLLAAGVKLTADDFGTLSQAAFVLQNQGLGPTKNMLDLVSQAMLTGRTRSLEMALGKMDLSRAEQNYADKIGVNVKNLTTIEKLEAKRAGMLDYLRGRVTAAGVAERDFGEQIEFVQTQLKNWGISLARAVAASPDVLNALSAIGDALGMAFGAGQQGLMDAVLAGINAFSRGVTAAVPYVVSFVLTLGTIWDAAKKAYDAIGGIQTILVTLGAIALPSVLTLLGSALVSVSGVMMSIVALEFPVFMAGAAGVVASLNPLTVAILAMWAAWEIGKTGPAKTMSDAFAVQMLSSNSATAALYRLTLGLDQLTPAQAKATVAATGMAVEEAKVETAAKKAIEMQAKLTAAMAAFVGPVNTASTATRALTDAKKKAVETAVVLVKSIDANALSFKTYVQAGILPLLATFPGLESGSARIVTALSTVGSAADATTEDIEQLQRAGRFLSVAMIDVNKSIATLPNVIPNLAMMSKEIEGAKDKTVTFVYVLGSLPAALTQLAQIAGDSFGAIGAIIGKTINTVETFTRAMEVARKAKESGDTAGAAMASAQGYAAMQAGIFGVIAALAELENAEIAAAEAAKWAALIAKDFKTASDFTQAFNMQVQALTDRLNEAAITVDRIDLALAGMNAEYSRGTATEWSLNTWRGLTTVLAEALKVNEAIAEMGGIGSLTAVQLAGVEDKVRKLFLLVRNEGPIGAEAIRTLDTYLVNIGQTALDSGGLVSQFFIDMIAKADEAGIALEGVADLMREFAGAAIAGFNAMVKSLPLDNWAKLSKAIQDAKLDVKDFLISQRDLKAAFADLPPMMATTITDLDKLDEAYEILGLTLDEDTRKAIDLQNALLGASTKARGAIGVVLGGLTNTTAITTNTGKNTPDTFAAQQQTALDLYRKLQAEIASIGGTTKDALEPMQGYFTAAAEASVRLNIPLDAGIQLLIDQSRQVGLWKNDFLDAMLAGTKAGEGLATAVERQAAAGVAARPGLEALGRTAVTSFAAGIASGMTFNEALRAISPGLTDLNQAFTDLNIPISDTATAGLMMANTMLVNNPALIAGVEALTGSSTALFNMGLLNEGEFADLQVVGLTMYTQLQGAAEAAGAGTRGALLPMQGWLQQAAAEAKRLGFELDAGTQMLIDQSVELGIWQTQGTTAAQSQAQMFQGILQVLILIGETLGATIPANLTAMSQAAIDSAGVMEEALGTDATDALTGPGGIEDEATVAAAALQLQLETAAQDTAQEMIAQMQAAALGLTGDANSLDAQAALAAGNLQSDLEAAALASGLSLNTEIGGAVTDLGVQFATTDWTSWAEEIIEAARRAKEAVDALAVGESPGGVREVSTQLHIAAATATDFAHHFVHEMDTVKAAVDDLAHRIAPAAREGYRWDWRGDTDAGDWRALVGRMHDDDERRSNDRHATTSNDGDGARRGDCDCKGGASVTVNLQAWDSQSMDTWLRNGGAQKIAEATVPHIPAVVDRYIGSRR